MKKLLLPTLLLLVSFQMLAQPDGYGLVWSDEFNGNGAIDASKWHHQTQLPNGYSWYNNEVQHYTNRTDNSFVSNGTLKIVAKDETFTDQGVTLSYTSARLNSKFAFTYGYVEIRAKLPTGVGTWPALWMLGQNITEPGGFWEGEFGTTGWPACGEIDILEHWGSNQNFVQSATHTPSSFGDTFNKGGTTNPTASTEFHIYSLEWTEERLVFAVDGTIHYIYNPSTQNAATWPFTENQYLLFNVAILPDITPAFTQSDMEIDYVRVYQEEALSTEDAAFVNEVQLFPNPVDNALNLNIASSIQEDVNVTIYSTLGKKLYQEVLSQNEASIDISQLARGVYFIDIQAGDKVVTKKFIKQ